MTIRPAQPADEETVRAIVAEAYEHYVARMGRRPGPMDDDYRGRIAAGQVWAREEAGEIVGIVVLEEQPGGLLLDNIAVRPGAQGRGHGRALIAFAEAEAARRGVATLRLYTNVLMVENIALYGRLGFTETGRFVSHGFQRVAMEKRVSPALPVHSSDTL